jgi:predicted Ser/Thr protein kinase
MDEIALEDYPTLIGGKFRLSPEYLIGRGSFGCVFMVKDGDGKSFAAKFEKKERGNLLPFEYHILKSLQNEVGFPKVAFFGEQLSSDKSITFLILIMELLGALFEIFFYF